MKVHTLNTAFGDCNIFELDNKTLTVDYGSTSHLDVRLSEYNKIVHSEKENFALLTHYHKDHLNGFNNYFSSDKSNTYRKFFLPKMVPDKFTGMNLLTKSIFISLFYSKSSIVFQTTKDSLILLQNLSKLRIPLVFLEKDDAFLFASDKYTVLWPEILKCKDIGQDVEDYKYLRDIKSNYSSEIDILTTKIISFFENSETDISTIVDEYKILHSKSYSDREEDSNKIYKLAKIKYTRQRKNLFKKMNDCSIVFHKPEFILMTGDITKKIFDNEIYGHLSPNYKLMKAPHHGTNKRSHVPTKIPKIKHMVINNGGTSYANRPINDQYNEWYNSKRILNVHCTNDPSKTFKRCSKQITTKVCKASSKCQFINDFVII